MLMRSSSSGITDVIVCGGREGGTRKREGEMKGRRGRERGGEGGREGGGREGGRNEGKERASQPLIPTIDCIFCLVSKIESE